MLAVARGQAEICRLLLENGADARLCDDRGRTAIDYIRGASPEMDGLLGSATTPQPPLVNVAEAQVHFEAAVSETGDGWEADEEQVRPVEDPSVRAEVAEVQKRAAAHRAIVDDESWDEIAIDLPAPVSPKVADPRRERERKRLRRLLRRVLEAGVHGSDELDACLEPGAEVDGRDDSAERRRLAMKLTIEALGYGPEEWSAWLDPDHPLRGAAIEEDVEEAIEHYDLLWSSPSAYEIHYRRIYATPSPSREMEDAAWRRHDSARAEVWKLILGNSRTVSVLLDVLEDESNEDVSALKGRLDAIEDDVERHESREAFQALIGMLAELASVHDPARALRAQALVDRLRLPNVIAEAVAAAHRARAPEAEVLEGALLDLRRRRDRLIEQNQRLVVWTARRYGWGALPLEDRIQEGNLGLIKAVERYNPARAARFGTYAIWWIRQAITRGIQDTGRTIRLPVHVADGARRIAKIAGELHGELGRPPSVEEMAVRAGMEAPRVRRLLKSYPDAQPLEDHPELARLMNRADLSDGPEEMTAAAMMRGELGRVMRSLAPREERVLRQRFGIGSGDAMTLEEVGEEFDVTRERIRQIEATAIRRLKHPSRSRRLRSFLEN
ncbi:MAG TPA: sigma-70 family RNA polymerase sigma factor [Phenylobacterium sp.]|uniref:sigma-70 family RNA polymerase sigma factor n=1 Tax=Phenylobacterium sp. TaxID=1871053 RepID=UPI002F945D50